MKYLTCAETAKLVRAALKKDFPGVKFSVRSSTYSGGASIDVSWTDGPKETAVKEVISQFEGADFDGMIDLKTHSEHWLYPDGRTEVFQFQVGHSYGSTTHDLTGEKVDPGAARDYVAGVRAASGTETFPGYDETSQACKAGQADGEARKAQGAALVSFGANYIFTRRDLSEAESRRLERAVAFLGGDDPSSFDGNKRYSFGAPGKAHWWEDYGHTLVHRLAYSASDEDLDEALNEESVRRPVSAAGDRRLHWVFAGGRPDHLAWTSFARATVG